MTRLLHLICDYGPGDMAWAEVTSAFLRNLPDGVRLLNTTVPAFDTIATGFLLAQLGLSDPSLRPADLFIFANTAPRKDNLRARQNNEGEGLLFLTMKNGVPIVAVNSGYSLSFILPEIQEIWSTHVEEAGSQFRSRDFFPQVVGKAVKGEFDFLNHRLDPREVVPPLPESVVTYVDSFGNIKTSIRQGDDIVTNLNPGDRVKVTINGFIRAATVATGSFNIMEGDLAFAPGSSGHSKRYWEIFKRGGSAFDDFGHPTGGSHIELLNT